MGLDRKSEGKLKPWQSAFNTLCYLRWLNSEKWRIQFT